LDSGHHHKGVKVTWDVYVVEDAQIPGVRLVRKGIRANWFIRLVSSALLGWWWWEAE
jgi:hypothetical protein